MAKKKLTTEEERVIHFKGTERPYTGKYYDFWEKGTYVCRQCGKPLYRSVTKFNAGCGWPSFEGEITGAVQRVPDEDGQRIEIRCAGCRAHLGHVFEGEGFTSNNIRHCVNSISLDFIPEQKIRATDTAIFAGGCFWGVAYYLKKSAGVLSVTAGYTGGSQRNPTYQEVCAGHTGHYEAIEVVFDPGIISYESLGKLFFEIHDPAQWNHQGPDWGEQYRSAVFYLNEDQKKVIEKLIGILKEKGIPVVTEIIPASTFWKAEDYHQDYYDRKGTEPYCHGYVKRF